MQTAKIKIFSLFSVANLISNEVSTFQLLVPQFPDLPNVIFCEVSKPSEAAAQAEAWRGFFSRRINSRCIIAAGEEVTCVSKNQIENLNSISIQDTFNITGNGTGQII